ncbi:UspA domain protein [Candidatus Zixiibacteriota bacterium]|nr:UspA domain protein [candidate division Zixibacteria bacterium]
MDLTEEEKIMETSGKNKKIEYMVPLDGSAMSKSALTAAKAMAKKRAAGIILLHVIEKNPPSTIHGEKHLTDINEANRYLEKIAEEIRSENIPVKIHVHPNREGDVARSIVEHAAEMNPDMVIMCTHGRGGFRGLWYGSIAQQALQLGTWPILLIPPAETESLIEFNPKKILVPLDGNHDFEPALNEAVPIAKAFGSRMHLVIVIPTVAKMAGERGTVGKFLPTAARVMLELAVQGGQDYLAGVAQKCLRSNLEVTTEVLRGDTVAEILEFAGQMESDLIVMSSHGRTGISAHLEGSVAHRVTDRAGIPLLLVKTEEDQA